MNYLLTALTCVAIITDSLSYKESGAAIEAYRQSIELGGKKTVLLLDRWGQPDSIRAHLYDLYVNQNLEGAILIGDVPIVMVRDAQHMTSAFKMNQASDWKQSSVASDRFYDDFDLRFDYIKADEDKPLYHYYTLRADSPQAISCDIYSSRMVVPEVPGADRYALLTAYLEKVVRLKAEEEVIDQILLFAGHGYNSDSMRARMDESWTLREQFAGMGTLPGYRFDFINFDFDEVIRPRFIAAMSDPGLDLAILHHHGAEDTQYLSASKVNGIQSAFDYLKNFLRGRLRRSKDTTATKEQYIREYDITDAWFEGAFDTEVTRRDSAYSASMNLSIEDMEGYTPQAKFVMFDACYNGSFYDENYIGGRYLFQEGNTVVARGNTVNSLQDIWPNEMIGLLQNGVCVGNWAKMNLTLELHLLGDATYAFANTSKVPCLDKDIRLQANNPVFWRRQLATSTGDYKALALRMLYRNQAISSAELLDIQQSDPNPLVRLEAFTLNKKIADTNLKPAALAALYDNYELLQRLGALTVNLIGDEDLLEPVMAIYFDPTTTLRINFHLREVFEQVPYAVFEAATMAYRAKNPLWPTEETFRALLKSLQYTQQSLEENLATLAKEDVTDKELRWAVSTQRNKQNAQMVDALLTFLRDTSRKPEQRVTTAETLGWYMYSFRKPDIVAACREIYATEQDPAVKNELAKTLGRLTGKAEEVAQAPVQRSFAIVVDRATYRACTADIEAYRRAVEKDGLTGYVLAEDWQSPEQVKALLKKYYREKALEGAVFVGQIPIPMVRQAQHLTSAFKMDESMPWNASSVPSDRFYDDFDLQFDFLRQDSVQPLFFYYNLSGYGPQEIVCDIYTGRIKPSLPGEEGYAQIRRYLQKVVAEKSQANKADCLVSYTGEGSFSNSLSAWKDEQVTLQEQFPKAFRTAETSKLYMFYMYPETIKEVITAELQRPEVDLFLFHEHGVPERQYLTGNPPATYEEAYFAGAQRSLRSLIAQQLRYGRFKEGSPEMAAYLRKMEKDYGIDSSWTATFYDPAVRVQDSLFDAAQGILLPDVTSIKPQARMVIFDACYNGDFREDDCIATRYILTEGSGTIVSFGNSVNVLQDKSSSDLLGLMAVGCRIGEWARMVNILESHIIGDPTFRFTGEGNPDIDFYAANPAYWLNKLQTATEYDVQGLALHKLHELSYAGLPELLYKTFCESPSYMLRLQCMHLLAHYDSPLYVQLLKKGATDPYEFIRRKSIYYMGKVGLDEFIPYVVQTYMEDVQSVRVLHNVSFVAGHFDTGLLRREFAKTIDKSDYLYDKQGYLADVNAMIESSENMKQSCWKQIDNYLDPKAVKSWYPGSLRNNPYPQTVDALLKALRDEQTDAAFRVQLAEILGWYVRAPRRGDIVQACHELLADSATKDPALRNELQKTMNRLTAYMR